MIGRMLSPLLLLFPPDPKNPILPPHLPDKEEEEVFVVFGLIRSILCDDDGRVPTPSPPTMMNETLFFASESNVSVSLFNASDFAAGAATMMVMTKMMAVDEAGGGCGNGEMKTRRRKV